MDRNSRPELHDLPVPVRKQVQAELVLLGLAKTLDAQQLLASGSKVLRQVDSNAERVLEEQLQCQQEAAWRERCRRFHASGGSLVFSGSQPLVEGARWQAILRGPIESQRRTSLERRGPPAQIPTPEQRRADALIAMIGHDGEPGPVGTGRPQVMVVLDYGQLKAAAAGAGTIGRDPFLSVQYDVFESSPFKPIL